MMNQTEKLAMEMGRKVETPCVTDNDAFLIDLDALEEHKQFLFPIRQRKSELSKMFDKERGIFEAHQLPPVLQYELANPLADYSELQPRNRKERRQGRGQCIGSYTPGHKKENYKFYKPMYKI